jgi:hypothetical protein
LGSTRLGGSKGRLDLTDLGDVDNRLLSVLADSEQGSFSLKDNASNAEAHYACVGHSSGVNGMLITP